MSESRKGIVDVIAEMREKGIYVFEWNVTPEDAAILLAMSNGNRKLRPHLINEYARLMKAGDWKVGNDCILITILNVLINAHHRLHAVVISGCTVRMLIRTNAEPDEATALDTGLKRDLLDAKAFDPSLDYINKTRMVIAKTAITDGGCAFADRDTSNEFVAKWVKKHLANIDKVTQDFFMGRDIKRITQSAVQAAFLTVSLKHPEHDDKLQVAAQNLLARADAKAANVEYEGEKFPGSNTLYILFQFLDEGRVTSAGGSSRKEIYQKTQALLRYYLQGEDVKGVRTKWDSDWYPCPDVVKFDKADPILLYKLKIVLSTMPVLSEFSPLTIGELLVKNGYAGTFKTNVERSLSKKFAKMVKDAKGNKLDFGDFCVVPVESEEKAKGRKRKTPARITAYMVVKK